MQPDKFLDCAQAAIASITDKKFRPKSVNVLGREYTIEYLDKASEVDIYKREALFGQVCNWTGTIRILDNRDEGAIFETIMHEVMHAICYGMQIEDENETVSSMISTALADTLRRNNWLRT